MREKEGEEGEGGRRGEEKERWEERREVVGVSSPAVLDIPVVGGGLADRDPGWLIAGLPTMKDDALARTEGPPAPDAGRGAGGGLALPGVGGWGAPSWPVGRAESRLRRAWRSAKDPSAEKSLRAPTLATLALRLCPGGTGMLGRRPAEIGARPAVGSGCMATKSDK